MATLKGISDKISGVTDKYGLANPIEVVNETFGGETREESRKRRAMAPSMLATPLTREEKAALREEATKLETPMSREKKEMLRDAAKMSKGGKVSSASKRADGIAQRGKTKGRMI